MLTSVRIPKESGGSTPTKTFNSGWPNPKQNHDASSIDHMQHTIGNQAVLRMAQTDEWAGGQSNRPSLYYGARGPEVIYLQRRLNLYGADLVEDGVFGPLTSRAVKQFQMNYAPPVDGMVGPVTWRALAVNPAATDRDFESIGQTPGTHKFVPGVVSQTQPSSLLPLAAMPVGPFAPFVNRNLVDRSIAALFNDLLVRFPNQPFARDAVDYALQELGNGNLVGMVLDTQIGLLRPRVPASAHGPINKIQKKGLENAGEYHRFDTQNISRGYIVVDDAQILGAQPPGRDRDLMQLMVVHELNHHRNRYRDKTMDSQFISSHEYVDVPLALQHRKPYLTTHVRRHFISELAAHHVAYHVKQERLRAQGQTTRPLETGQFFNAALILARKHPESYYDNGYMEKLAARKPDDDFRKQVAIWMHNLRKHHFLSNPAQNAWIQLMMKIEFIMARQRNFTQTSNGPAGLA